MPPSVLRRIGPGRRVLGVVRAPDRSLEPPDEALVGRALAGERRAAAMLYERHLPYLLGMAVRMLRSRSDGEDVVQETFAIALERLASLRDPGSFQSWAAQIAVNLVRRRLRRRRLLALLGLDGPAEDGTLEALAGSLSDGEVRAELGLVDAVLGELPAEQRLAWMLRHVEGEELERVAALCGCSLATAKRRIAAAAARMSAHLAIEEMP